VSNHDDIPDDKLGMLQQTSIPAPSDAARRRALDAAMVAFDAEQASQKAAAKGNPLAIRLRSIFQDLKGKWTMDTRLTYGLGTAAVALLLLPMGYQLYSTTAITPVNLPITVTSEPADQPVTSVEGPMANGRRAVAPEEQSESLGAVMDAASDELADAMPEAEAPMPEPVAAAKQQAFTEQRASPSGAAVQQAPMQEFSAAMPAPTTMMAPMPSRDAMMVQPAAPGGDQFTTFTESPVQIVREAPVSTFSIDVDTASYSYVRRMLNEGFLPEPDAVRIEEMINYFDYAYPAPTDAATPFSTTVQVYPAPWNTETQLVQIGIKGYVPPVGEDTASNLVFLIDTSGSMDEPDKLPLLKRAFGLLVDRMGENDTISIVAYAGSAGVVLAPTRGTEKATILAALDKLSAGGSTAGAQGIELAYELAAQHKVADGVNRVILATDGDFNVGIEDPAQLETYIKGKRDNGIFLSVLGFGAGNLGDDTMQALAQNGNGNASYIDSFAEAQKVLVEDAGGTLETIAKDVKIQVEFNPEMVSEYRLIGYETRALNREDFNNDKVDAGEIGAGTTVTALYEITPVGSDAERNDPLRYSDRCDGETAGIGENRLSEDALQAAV
jgi:Ca-activated chloride channel family protein